MLVRVRLDMMGQLEYSVSELYSSALLSVRLRTLVRTTIGAHTNQRTIPVRPFGIWEGLSSGKLHDLQRFLLRRKEEASTRGVD